MRATDLILIAGGSGYVGGRLAAQLQRSGRPLRCLARRPAELRGRVAATTEVVHGDCLDPASLGPALRGVRLAYYLVHSLQAGERFAELDRQAARNFGMAARDAGVERIVYLGGLGQPGQELSEHLRSRQETGEALRDSRVPVIELRASVVIGPGSLSFEMVRALVERLPVMVCPAWVRVAAQPIGIEDLLEYLQAAADLPGDASRVFEIGGPDVVTYADIMKEYARQRGLRRLLLPVPLLTPRLSGLWLGLVTPLYARVGRALIDGVRNPTVVRSDSAHREFPSVRPRGLAHTLARALAIEDAEFAARRWGAAGSPAGETRRLRHGGRLGDTRAVVVPAPPHAAFAPIRRIGGARGFYSAGLLWRLRGWLDALLGGVGARRGRRNAEQLQVGDEVGAWRVEAYERDTLLRLVAEMKLPGRAWLQFEVTPVGAGRSEIRQTALFDPRGLGGQAYWHLVYPLHARIFSGMLRAIARLALAEARAERNSIGRRAHAASARARVRQRTSNTTPRPVPAGALPASSKE